MRKLNVFLILLLVICFSFKLIIKDKSKNIKYDIALYDPVNNKQLGFWKGCTNLKVEQYFIKFVTVTNSSNTKTMISTTNFFAIITESEK